MSPYFSVIIATHNDAGVLPRAIRSVIAQSFDDLELVVVDDGSTDDTGLVVGSFDDGRLHYLKEPHRGVSATRNRGLKVAHGRFVTFIDSDDEALPRWLEFTQEALERRGAAIARCGATHVGGQGFVLKTEFVDPESPLTRFVSGTYALGRDLLVELGGFDERLHFGEHTELALRLRERGLHSAATVVPRPLIRMHHWRTKGRRRSSRAEMARYCLDRYGATMGRRERASYRAIIGVQAARSGDLKQARGALAHAWITRPERVKALGWVVASCIPYAARRVWTNATEQEAVSADAALRLRPRPSSGAPRLVSVIVPARNAAATLPSQLYALSRQDYDGPWEVIVANNGSTDSTASVAAAWKDRLPDLTIVDAPTTRGASHSRNRAAIVARGDLILLCDSDDEVSPSWLRAMASAARHADLVGAVLETELLNSEAARAMRPVPPLITHGMKAFLPFAPGAACGAWSDVIYWLGGWDESYVGGADDADFSWRCQLAGFRVEWAQDALVHYRLRENLASQMRQLFRYGRAHPLLYRRYRWAGMPGLNARGIANRWGWLIVHLPDLFKGTTTRRYWIRVATLRLGHLYGSIAHRVLYP